MTALAISPALAALLEKHTAAMAACKSPAGGPDLTDDEMAVATDKSAAALNIVLDFTPLTWGDLAAQFEAELENYQGQRDDVFRTVPDCIRQLAERRAGPDLSELEDLLASLQGIVLCWSLVAESMGNGALGDPTFWLIRKLREDIETIGEWHTKAHAASGGP